MVSANNLTTLEKILRTITISIFVFFFAWFILTSIYQKYTAPALVEYTTLTDGNTKTSLPTIQFCLQDVSMNPISGLSVSSKITSADKKTVSSSDSLMKSTPDTSCAIFQGDKYSSYKLTEAPTFGFFLDTSATNSTFLSTALIHMSIYDSSEINSFLIPISHLYILKYTETRFYGIDSTSSPKRDFALSPFFPLTQPTPTNITTIYISQRDSQIDVRTEYASSHPTLNFFANLGGLAFLLMFIYGLLFGSFRVDPWGLVGRLLVLKEDYVRKAKNVYAKGGKRPEIPFLNDADKSFDRNSFEGEIRVLRRRVVALERVLKGYVVRTDVVERMFAENDEINERRFF
ncbi:5370_t:CDS:1 [Ambispora gerdemannii]|uniref:5370_t:CDS:1 n=1 Tax=Ambispora gerdemannii TaxID=144530 RepID=A0A9N9FSW6_9GLOM|nr:5370_t:CDS:1 [Ambispora gerdemannii]